MTRRGFDEAWEMGEVARNYVAQRLVADRWQVVPLDRIEPVNGRGPASFGRGGVILPDLQATKGRQSLAVEVKGKEAATLGTLTGQLEHGIDLAAYDDYRDYDRQVAPVFLVVVEVGPQPWTGRDTYCARVSALRVRASMMRGVPMVYWPRSQMTADWLLRLNRSVLQRHWPQGRAQGELL